MLPEIALNILDIAQNSVRAGASLIEITLSADTAEHTLLLTVRDNGCGMTAEQLERVTDPFYTSRSTRKVGLGLPFLKQAAEASGGLFQIVSERGSGTTVSAKFHTDHIDCMPTGNLTETMLTLIAGLDTDNRNTDDVSQDRGDTVEVQYTYRVNDRSFVLDTREIREILGGIPFSEPEVYQFLSVYLEENKQEVDGGEQ